MKLNPKHKVLADAWLSGSNGAEAALLAGYTGTAQVRAASASRILNRPDVRSYIRAHDPPSTPAPTPESKAPKAKALSPSKTLALPDPTILLDRALVLARLSEIAIDRSESTVVQLKALDQLAKCLGLYTQHHTLSPGSPVSDAKPLPLGNLSLETLRALESELDASEDEYEDDSEDEEYEEAEFEEIPPENSPRSGLIDLSDNSEGES